MDILHELNVQQRKAAAYGKGAILVIAGPGTGKTKVITHRIAHLIRNQQVAPQQIFAVTFTNKAAQEMLERVKELLGTTQGLDVRVHTFHAFCVGLLREHAGEINLSRNYAIFDQQTQEEILVECLRELKQNRLEYPPWLLRNVISTYKMQLADPTANTDEIRTADGTTITDATQIQNIAALMNAYQTKLAAYNALDFDDLISKSVEALEKVPSVRAKYHNELRFLLVDEYQDINAAQYKLIKLLVRSPEHNVMVVADEDQSIYSWRGSTPQYIEQFKAEFNPEIVELDEHYRCSEKILRAAQAVIAKNTRQKESVLKTHKPAGHTIYHYTLPHSDAEASHIFTLIRKLVDELHYSYGDIAVFYRTHQLAEALVDRLQQEQMQFQRIGRISSFQEPHAQGIVSYLNFIQWELPRDIERAINFPQQLIDDLTLVRLKWLAQRNGITLVELLKRIDDYPQDVGPLTRRNVRQFFTEIAAFRQQIEGEKIHAVVNRLFELLARRRSPYFAEDLLEIAQLPEIAGLKAAADALYSATERGEPIQLIATYGIDTYCAAQMIQEMFGKYLDIKLEVHLLSDEIATAAPSRRSGVSIRIGRFGDLSTLPSTTILMGEADKTGANVIPLLIPDDPHGLPHSVTALKLCQQLLGYYETPNLSEMIVYDLETIDNDPNRAQIIEIGAKRLSAVGSELERYYQLVKPPAGIPKYSTQIHGIDNETVASEPSIETVLPQFLSFAHDRILIGHNIEAFDNRVLERDLGHYLKRGLPNPYYDTFLTAQRLFPRETCNLEALADKFGIEHDQMHRAIEDVHVTHRVFDALIKEDLRRRQVCALREFLPLVGVGTLAWQASQANAPEAPPFYRVAARYVRQHQPALDALMEKLEESEQQRVKDFAATLARKEHQQYDTPEEQEWQAQRARFMNGVLHFEATSKHQTLAAFLDYQKLVSSVDEADVELDKVTLMTLHAAKGTEFPVVIIMGMEEGTTPIWRKGQPVAELEEERRLFYVGMTRAQNRLYLTSALRRNSDRERERSMFVREIPSNLISFWSRWR